MGYSGNNGSYGNNGDGTIDWDAELRRIERQFDGLPSHTQLRLQKVQEIVERSRMEERLEVAGVWLRLVLIGALTAALFWWPYGQACGWRLAGFLGAHGVVVLGGLLLARAAWRTRQGWVFSASALFILIAWTVLALQTLPRMRLDRRPMPSVTWVCSR